MNAFIGTHHGSALPPEFSLLRFEPEPWSGPDVIVWVKMMAWDLSANYPFELLRDDLVRAVGAERMAQLMPPYPTDGLSSMSPAAASEAGGSGAVRWDWSANSTALGRARRLPERRRSTRAPPRAHRALAGGVPSVAAFLLGGASPEVARVEQLGRRRHDDGQRQAAAGQRSAPRHARALDLVPRARVGGDFDVIGATLPGTPAVALGRNRFIAWGATNVAADVEDLYRERLDAAGTFAEFRGAHEPVTTVPETIVVKGAAARPADRPRHAPRSARFRRDQRQQRRASRAARRRSPRRLEPLAFRWTALDADDTTLVVVPEAERGAQLGGIHRRAA